jgi:histone H3/H4
MSRNNSKYGVRPLSRERLSSSLSSRLSNKLSEDRSQSNDSNLTENVSSKNRSSSKKEISNPLKSNKSSTGSESRIKKDDSEELNAVSTGPIASLGNSKSSNDRITSVTDDNSSKVVLHENQEKKIDEQSLDKEQKSQESIKNPNTIEERLRKLKERLQSSKYSSESEESHSSDSYDSHSSDSDSEDSHSSDSHSDSHSSDSENSYSDDSNSDYESRNIDYNNRNAKTKSSESSDTQSIKKMSNLSTRDSGVRKGRDQSSAIRNDIKTIEQKKTISRRESSLSDNEFGDKKASSFVRSSVASGNSVLGTQRVPERSDGSSNRVERRSRENERHKEKSKQNIKTDDDRKTDRKFVELQTYSKHENIDSKIDELSENSDNEEYSAFDEIPRAAFLKLIKNGGAQSVSSEAADEIRDILQDFVENMFEYLTESNSSIETRDIKDFMNGYIHDEEDLPRELVIKQTEFERSISKLCDKFKTRIRRDSMYVIQLFSEAIIYKVVEGGMMVMTQCRQQRLSDKHLATAYKIYML